jgi:probable phosphoglycerate mutase
MTIFFIRHGETTGDVENRYGGAYDDHLTERGRMQAEELAGKLSQKGIEVIFSSPFFRARETAEILAKKLGCEIMVKQHLRERSMYGVLTGMKREEAKKLYPDLVELVKDQMNTLPGAESYQDFSNRIQLKVLFRDILKKGEIGDVADCGYVECEVERGNLKVNVLHGITTMD